MELLEPCKAMNHPWPAPARRIRSATRSHIRIAPAQHLAPRTWMLQQRLSSLSHGASDTRVSGIIRDFHFELPGTVQYTFTRYFSTRKSASPQFLSAILHRSQRLCPPHAHYEQ